MRNPSWLTKSRFQAGLQCEKRLWLQVHQPQNGGTSSRVLQTGLEVGALARQLCPGGALAWHEGQSTAAAITNTQELVAAGVPAIFEATFQVGRLMARVDILRRGRKSEWHICEVKAATELKDEHIDDIAFQYYVARKAGVRVGQARLLHVRRAYVLKSKDLDPRAYFKQVDVTKQVLARCRKLSKEIDKLLDVIDEQRVPKIDPWTHCSRPYSCEFLDQCVRKKPKDWILYLPNANEKRLTLLRQRKINAISKIPDDIDLSPGQSIVRDAHRLNRPYVSEQLGSALRQFGPPAFYLDFEAMSPAVPIYRGTKPYERIPFQWSLHELRRSGELRHDGFLADGREDPRGQFLESLLDKLGKSSLPVIVYSSYEKATLNQVASYIKGYSRPTRALVARLRDLLNVVRLHVYYPQFLGSYSIKSVAPILAPEINYGSLADVADGGAAAQAFERIARGCSTEERERLRVALVEYCRLDTLAMLRVHQRLELTSKKGQLTG